MCPSDDLRHQILEQLNGGQFSKCTGFVPSMNYQRYGLTFGITGIERVDELWARSAHDVIPILKTTMILESQ